MDGISTMEELLHNLRMTGKKASEVYYRALVNRKDQDFFRSGGLIDNANSGKVSEPSGQELGNWTRHNTEFKEYNQSGSDNESPLKRPDGPILKVPFAKELNTTCNINWTMTKIQEHMNMISHECECFFSSCSRSHLTSADRRHLRAFHMGVLPKKHRHRKKRRFSDDDSSTDSENDHLGQNNEAESDQTESAAETDALQEISVKVFKHEVSNPVLGNQMSQIHHAELSSGSHLHHHGSAVSKRNSSSESENDYHSSKSILPARSDKASKPQASHLNHHCSAVLKENSSSESENENGSPKSILSARSDKGSDKVSRFVHFASDTKLPYQETNAPPHGENHLRIQLQQSSSISQSTSDSDTCPVNLSRDPPHQGKGSYGFEMPGLGQPYQLIKRYDTFVLDKPLGQPIINTISKPFENSCSSQPSISKKENHIHKYGSLDSNEINFTHGNCFTNISKSEKSDHDLQPRDRNKILQGTERFFSSKPSTVDYVAHPSEKTDTFKPMKDNHIIQPSSRKSQFIESNKGSHVIQLERLKQTAQHSDSEILLHALEPQPQEVHHLGDFQLINDHHEEETSTQQHGLSGTCLSRQSSKPWLNYHNFQHGFSCDIRKPLCVCRLQSMCHSCSEDFCDLHELAVLDPEVLLEEAPDMPPNVPDMPNPQEPPDTSDPEVLVDLTHPDDFNSYSESVELLEPHKTFKAPEPGASNKAHDSPKCFDSESIRPLTDESLKIANPLEYCDILQCTSIFDKTCGDQVLRKDKIDWLNCGTCCHDKCPCHFVGADKCMEGKNDFVRRSCSEIICCSERILNNSNDCHELPDNPEGKANESSAEHKSWVLQAIDNSVTREDYSSSCGLMVVIVD
ncbi:hypothetical protein ElyMa_003554400 [Elysia marginata]|uniref:C2H2-type domain-containing protein n=1 Tax=Elysia marginata TaxID=1093978 RepID=A0AAV4EKU4_9GAST|nr:hypothetical protein ElyMa_003554400 [Elysia marginata]